MSGGDRLEAMFARTRAEGRPALIIFTPCGFPERDATVEVVEAAIDGGADAVEIGFPFSDPLGDGPTNQRAYDDALRDGFVPSELWEVVRRLRSGGVSVPLLIMGYFNPLFAYGVSEFVQEASSAGVDGLIVVDLPPEEASELERPARAVGLHVVYLLAPTSTDERIELVAAHGSGFIYCVSVTGVTGARTELSEEVPGLLARVRRRTDLPLAVGFGISAREHVLEAGRIADAAVVGSAFVDTLANAPAGRRADVVRAYVEGISGRDAGKLPPGE